MPSTSTGSLRNFPPHPSDQKGAQDIMLRSRLIISCVVIAALALAGILTSTALSQTFRGGISGSVVDSNGATIAGATVRLLNEGTGLARNQETTSAGEFNFPDLQVGLYTLSVTKQGDRKSTRLNSS